LISLNLRWTFSSIASLRAAPTPSPLQHLVFPLRLSLPFPLLPSQFVS
jgi:hypothetical protein